MSMISRSENPFRFPLPVWSAIPVLPSPLIDDFPGIL
jgi:hypothetical protein